MYGKTTVLAWIPIANLFLLGKLCFDSNIAGWLLIGGVVILSLLMKFSLIFAYINILIIIGLVILAVYKYIKLKKKTGNLNNQ